MPARKTTELYDLGADPAEHHNLAARKPELLRKLLDELRRFQQRHGLDPALYGLEASP